MTQAHLHQVEEVAEVSLSSDGDLTVTEIHGNQIVVHLPSMAGEEEETGGGGGEGEEGEEGEEGGGGIFK